MEQGPNFQNIDTRFMRDRNDKVSVVETDIRGEVRSVDVPRGLFRSDKVKAVTLEYFKDGLHVKVHRMEEAVEKGNQGIVYNETVQSIPIILGENKENKSFVDFVFGQLNYPTLKFVLFKDLDPGLNEEAQRTVYTRELSKFIVENADWKNA